MTIPASLRAAVWHGVKNWKTTLSGICSAVIGLSAAAVAPNPWLNSALAAKILGAASIARVVLGLIQTDGKQISIAPQGPVSIALPPGADVKQTTTIHTEGK